MLVDEYELVNLDLTYYLIDANPDFKIDSVNNEAGMQPIIEQPSKAVLK